MSSLTRKSKWNEFIALHNQHEMQLVVDNTRKILYGKKFSAQLTLSELS